jgi:hypothetical protein
MADAPAIRSYPLGPNGELPRLARDGTRRGAAPGERRGGRRKGSKNKDVIERAMIGDLRKQGRKLAKEILDEFMHYFAAAAIKYAPYIVREGVDQINPNADQAKFMELARAACDAADKLAPYQSSKMATIALFDQTANVAPEEKRRVITLNIFEEGKAVGRVINGSAVEVTNEKTKEVVE